MICRSPITAALLTLAAIAATPANAKTPFVNDVPNGDALACETCHIEAPNVNWFGADVYWAYPDAPAEPEVRWAKLYRLDSDLDGQTNGVELGDPCGLWRPGDEDPEQDEYSNPGDAESMIAVPPVVECPPIEDTGHTGDTGTIVKPESLAGCWYSVIGTAPGQGGLLALTGLALLLGRRRENS